MIPVARPAEPADFDARVRQPGTRWLAEHAEAKRPKPYWDACLAELAEGFASLCGYAAMFDPTGGTVDHYLSWKNHPDKTYEWSNYRFASGPLNCSKQNADESVLDPYEVGEDWFEIILPSLQMRLTEAVPVALRAKAEYTLTRLKLRDGERVLRWRRSWYALYQNRQITLEGLRKVAPLLAAAVGRAGT